MANLITDDPLRRAIEAAQQGNWDVVQQSLRQMESQPELVTVAPDDIAARLHDILTIALDTLHEGDFQDRWDVAKGFSALGERAIAPLVEVLQSQEADPDARWFAARILGDLQRPSALRALVELLKRSTDPELCTMVATALSNFGEAAIADLAELLQHSATRLTATRALSAIQSEQVVTPLLSVVEDGDAQIRAIALETLGYLQDSRVPLVLAQALQDPDARVRKAAAMGLGSCIGQVPDAVERLQPLLADEDGSVAQQAAIAMGRTGSTAAATALEQALPTAPLTLQIQIVQSLGWMETAAAAETLHRLLQNSATVEAAVWDEAVAALGRAKTPSLRQRNVACLIELLQRDDASISAKRTVIVALGTLGDRAALAPLIKQLAEPDAGIRLHILAALKTIDADAALHQLRTLAFSETLSPLQHQGIAFALEEW